METPLPQLNDVVKKFNLKVQEFISRIERKTRTEKELADIDLLKKRISLLRATLGPTVLIDKATPVIIGRSETILDRAKYDIYITKTDARAEYLKINGKIDQGDEFIFALIDSVKKYHANCGPDEKNDIYQDVVSLLSSCIEYRLLTPIS